MKRSLTVLALCLAATGLTRTQRASAQAEAPPTAREIVVAYNVGSRFSIAPGIFIPRDGQRVGFSIAGDYRYGIELGPVVLAPGVRLSGFFPSQFVALSALGTARLTVPLGPVGPYVMGGVGPGYVSKPAEPGLAFMGGGGLMVYVGQAFAIGAEATYLGITGTRFRALFIGPSLLLGF